MPFGVHALNLTTNADGKFTLEWYTAAVCCSFVYRLLCESFHRKYTQSPLAEWKTAADDKYMGRCNDGDVWLQSACNCRTFGPVHLPHPENHHLPSVRVRDSGLGLVFGDHYGQELVLGLTYRLRLRLGKGADARDGDIREACARGQMSVGEEANVHGRDMPG